MGKKNAVLPVAKARILTARVKEEWCDVCLPVCLRGLPYMTSAVGGGRGPQKADKRSKIR